MMPSDKTKNDYTKVPTRPLLKDPDPDVPLTYGYGIRHIQLMIFILCLSISFLSRGHLGVTIVAMSNPPDVREIYIANISASILNNTANNLIEDIEINETDLIVNINNTEGKVKSDDSEYSIYRTYDWPKPIQETILGSFFLGYLIMTFPAGMICQRWGGKLLFQISLFINGIMSIATPWMALWGGWKAVCFCRIVQGLSQAGTFPSVQTLLAKWVSNSERATLGSYLYSGTTLGNVIAFQLGGVLGDSRWGWPSTFWVVGALCLICFLAITIFGAASPEEHSSISQEEKNYILGRVSDGIVQKPKVPWKAMMTSKPLWATFVAHIGGGLVFVFFFTQVPSYVHYILGIDVKSSGLLSSLPYVASFFTSICFGMFSDYCTNRKLISVKTARRINNSISQIGISVSLILASFTNNTAVAVTCFVVGMGCYMAVHIGWMMNHIDLAPNFAGTMMSIGNLMMNCILVLVPVVVSHIVTDVRNPHQWRIMFGMIAGVAIFCNTVFVIFLSTEKQPWNSEDYPAVKSKENEVKDKNNFK